MPDRAPLPPPFPVGTHLRLIRDRGGIYAGDGTPLEVLGTEAVIVRVKEGRRGTLRLIEVDDYTGEEIRDTTRDGYSVWNRVDGSGRIIWPANADEWERI